MKRKTKNKKRKLEVVANIFLLSILATCPAFANASPMSEEVVEPKPDQMSEAQVSAEGATIEGAVELDSSLDLITSEVIEAGIPSGPASAEHEETHDEGPVQLDSIETSVRDKAENATEDVAEESTAEEEITPYLPHTEDDAYILARAAYFEMGTAMDREDAEYVLKMTMSVILNRVTASDFPNTVSEVVFSSGYAKRTQRLVKSEEAIPDILYTWAEDVLTNGPNVPTDIIYQAGFKQGHGVYDCILGNYFCHR